MVRLKKKKNSFLTTSQKINKTENTYFFPPTQIRYLNAIASMSFDASSTSIFDFNF